MAKTPSTQEHLNIEDIVDNLLVLKNGVVSLVLETSALNFDLLSEEEQDARILAFANLLNGVDYQVEISVRTVRTDVSDYVKKLEDYKNQQVSRPLMRQIEIYIQFIKNLTTRNEVLDKRFFVTIPYRGGMVPTPSFFKKLVGGKSQITETSRVVERAKLELYPKRDNIVRLFKKMGITARQLTNNELLMLLYDIYDPDKVGYQKVGLDIKDYTSSVVQPLT